VVPLGTRLIFKRDRFHCLRCKQDFSSRLFELTKHHMITRDVRSLFDFEIPDDRVKVLHRLRRQMKFQITLCLHCHEMVHELGERTFFYPNKRWHARHSSIVAIAEEKPKYLEDGLVSEAVANGKPMIMVAEIVTRRRLCPCSAEHGTLCSVRRT